MGRRQRRCVGALVLAALVVASACADDDAGAEATSTTTLDASSDSTGAISVTVPTVPAVIDDPVAIDATADFGNGVQARLESLEAVDAVATFPGERSGPAVRVTVEISNASAEPINLDNVIIDLATAEGVPAYLITDSDQVALHGDLPAGETQAGSYVFTIAPEERDAVTVNVKYSAAVPTVVFAGPAPRA